MCFVRMSEQRKVRPYTTLTNRFRMCLLRGTN
jgi:hypothetical protein